MVMIQLLSAFFSRFVGKKPLLHMNKRKLSLYCYCWKRDALSGLWLNFIKMIVSSSLQPIVNLDIGHLHPSADYLMMFLSHKLSIEKVHKNISLSR